MSKYLVISKFILVLLTIFLCIFNVENLIEYIAYGLEKAKFFSERLSDSTTYNQYNIIVGHTTDAHIITIKQNGDIVYLGTDSTKGIQTGISLLLPGQRLLLLHGNYEIRGTLNVTRSAYIYGETNETTLIFKNLENRNAIWMSKGSRISNVNIIGSIKPLPYDFTQKIIASDNTMIRNVTISHMGYGIETAGSNNVNIYNIKCEYLQSQNDWAACVHGGKTRLGKNTNNLTINKFNISYSNRAIELDAVVYNVYASDGYVFQVRNFHNTMHEAFTLDIHSHDGEGYSQNVTYRNIYLKDSYSPTTKITGRNPQSVSQNYSEGDLPRNILYDNITINNPTSTWQVNGNNITIRNSTIIASKTNIFDIFMNTKNLLFENVQSIDLTSNKFFIFTNYTNTNRGSLNYNEYLKPIYNLTLNNNKIYCGRDKIGPSIFITNVKGLTFIRNEIINPPKNSITTYLNSVSNINENNNSISYLMRTNEIPK